MTRIVGLLGRQEATTLLGVGLINRYVSSIPDAPAVFDHTNGFDKFQMLGNGPDPTLTVNHGKAVGDCAWVMTVNTALVEALETNEPFTMPSSNEVVGDYLVYDHGKDVGANLNQLFAYWRKIGLPWGGKLCGHAGVNFRDYDESMAYCNAFGCLPIGIAVTRAMQAQTARGEPWDITGSPLDDQVVGGHAVLVLNRDELATWGMRQKYTERWWKVYVEEAHVALTQSQVDRHGDGYGIDVEHLESALNQAEAA